MQLRVCFFRVEFIMTAARWGQPSIAMSLCNRKSRTQINSSFSTDFYIEAEYANYCGKNDLWNDIFIVWIESPHSTGLRCHASHVKCEIFSERRTAKNFEFSATITACSGLSIVFRSAGVRRYSAHHWIRFVCFFVVQNSWNAIVKPANNVAWSNTPALDSTRPVQRYKIAEFQNKWEFQFGRLESNWNSSCVNTFSFESAWRAMRRQTFLSFSVFRFFSVSHSVIRTVASAEPRTGLFCPLLYLEMRRARTRPTDVKMHCQNHCSLFTRHAFDSGSE